VERDTTCAISSGVGLGRNLALARRGDVNAAAAPPLPSQSRTVWAVRPGERGIVQHRNRPRAATAEVADGGGPQRAGRSHAREFDPKGIEPRTIECHRLLRNSEIQRVIAAADAPEAAASGGGLEYCKILSHR